MEEGVSLGDVRPGRFYIPQTDLYLAQIGQSGIVVPLLVIVTLDQLGCSGETIEGLFVLLLEIVVVAPIIIVYK